MLYPSINEIKKKADSRYTLVIMAAKRARDIIDGKPVLTTDCDNDKPVSEAAFEINEDLVTYRRVEEAGEAAAEAAETAEAAGDEVAESSEDGPAEGAV